MLQIVDHQPSTHVTGTFRTSDHMETGNQQRQHRILLITATVTTCVMFSSCVCSTSLIFHYNLKTVVVVSGETRRTKAKEELFHVRRIIQTETFTEVFKRAITEQYLSVRYIWLRGPSPCDEGSSPSPEQSSSTQGDDRRTSGSGVQEN